jgi:long-subunit fatty acid transport protein
VFSVSTGLQYQLADPLYVRCGYTYNENPEPGSQILVAVAAPLHYQHQLNFGGSFRVSRNAWINGAYSYWFEHEVNGSIDTPYGEMDIASREIVHIGSVGVTVGY